MHTSSLDPCQQSLPRNRLADFLPQSAAVAPKAAIAPPPLITLVLPFFNEAGYIERTIASLARQNDRRFALRLVDNASTDDSVARAEAACAQLVDVEVRFMSEATPGKIHALVTGLADIETPFLATLDADTLYPPEYIGTCIALFHANPGAAAVMAIGLCCTLGPAARRRAIWLTRLRSTLFRSKCHSGAYAQSFRTAAYKGAGGYDLSLWDYVLEDHEIVHRISRFGHLVYDTGHSCTTSDRRTDRTTVSWSVGERLLYAVIPISMMHWYFDVFLRNRFQRRELFNLNLRTLAPRPAHGMEGDVAAFCTTPQYGKPASAPSPNTTEPTTH
ncbi:glycosyltransferase family 2 protein [Sphingomonas populi]|uniref:Glycosyltransferase family 2 protein n=2 Tax=Sphingomonas populi TaxID=2484750 RepID=A0A4Q6XWM5_9SPHN|nr:glycosyltransferase family 2 protein [Sphingomonas populi]